MKPDAIFIPGYAPQGTLIVSQAVRVGLKTAFFGADGLDDDLMLKNKDAEGLFVTTPFLPDAAGPEAKGFIAAYTTKFGKEPNWFAANTYDAVGLAVEALSKAGENREVNGRTVIVGYGYTKKDAIMRAVYWQADEQGSYGPPMRLAGIDGNARAFARATNISSSGKIVGYSSIRTNSPRNSVIVTVMWTLP